MPYLGDAPSNPVPLTLSGGAATGVATGPTDHDRHVCWFQVPAQAAGNSIQLDTLLGGLPGGSYLSVVMVWDGGNTAHYIAFHDTGGRQEQAIRGLPAGVPVLIGVFPDGHIQGARGNDRGVDNGLSALTVAAWDAEFPPALTRRLPANVELAVQVAATTDPVGTPTNPAVMDFTTSPDTQTFDVGAWGRPTFEIHVVLPAGYGIEVMADGYEPAVDLVDALLTMPRGSLTVFRPNPAVTPQVLAPFPVSYLPTGMLRVRAVRISDVSGTAFDTDGVSAEPCNVLLFRTNDAMRAVEAPTGSYTFQSMPEDDYILVAFSQADGRDVRATNVLVPPGTRAPGGGYVFPPPGG